MSYILELARLMLPVCNLDNPSFLPIFIALHGSHLAVLQDLSVDLKTSRQTANLFDIVHEQIRMEKSGLESPMALLIFCGCTNFN